MPRGFGAAWFDWRTETWLCLPIGLHLVAAWVRRAYHRMRADATPSVLDAAFERGREFQRKRDAKYDALVNRDGRVIHALAALVRLTGGVGLHPLTGGTGVHRLTASMNSVGPEQRGDVAAVCDGDGSV